MAPIVLIIIGALGGLTPPMQAPLARRPLASRDLLLGERCLIPPSPGVRRRITYPISAGFMAVARANSWLANGLLPRVVV